MVIDAEQGLIVIDAGDSEEEGVLILLSRELCLIMAVIAEVIIKQRHLPVQPCNSNHFAQFVVRPPR